MIIYCSTKAGFADDLPQIHNVLKQSIYDKLGEEVGDSEFKSWENSLPFMGGIIADARIPDDVGIVLEYNIPVSQNRVDFIITGFDEKGARQAVLIELKQWERIHKTDMDGVVETYLLSGK